MTPPHETADLVLNAFFSLARLFYADLTNLQCSFGVLENVGVLMRRNLSLIDVR